MIKFYVSFYLIFILCLNFVSFINANNSSEKALVNDWIEIAEFLQPLLIDPFERRLGKLLAVKDLNVSRDCLTSLTQWHIAIQARQKWAYKSKCIARLR